MTYTAVSGSVHKPATNSPTKSFLFAQLAGRNMTAMMGVMVTIKPRPGFGCSGSLNGNPTNCIDQRYDNSDIHFYTCHGGDNQMWFHDINCRLRNLAKYDDGDNWCMDTQGNNNIYGHPCNGGDRQQWNLSAEFLNKF